MPEHYHSVVIGGGCLGCAAAVSLARHVKGQDHRVCVIEKSVLGAGLSSRHSAIVRSANASRSAAYLAKMATRLWKSLASVWGVAVPWEQPGAVWIGRDGTNLAESKWRQMETSMQALDIAFTAIGRDEAKSLTGGSIRLGAEELFFHEPEVLQLDSSEILHGLQSAVRLNGITLKEHTRVTGFRRHGEGRIGSVITNHGEIHCDFVVNAAGGWSPALFSSLGLNLPVSLEPVYAANWLISARDLSENLPIIADFNNRAYFRRWRGSILHMHQPRERDPASIAAAFSRSLMNPAGADVIYDAFNFGVSHQQIDDYRDKIRNRFPSIDAPLYSGGYLSFFDITPDLKFILGADTRIDNLIHCLGAGQALKYAPAFGELVADLILTGSVSDPNVDLSEFSIRRFEDKPLRSFWCEAASAQNCL